MKGLKKLIIWTLIPVTLELAGFFYIDNFYLNDETNFNAKKVELSNKKNPNKINVKVSDSAKNIGISYNGDYISYYENGVINVIDTSNNKKKEIKFDDNGNFSSYKWLPDRDIMLVAEKYIDYDGSSYVKFQSYNAKKDEKTVLSNENNKQLKIPLSDSKYEVLDMTLSTATNVTYVEIGREGAKSRVYRINVMVQMEETKYVNCKLGKISATNKEDKLVYEDVTNNRIRVVGKKDPVATGENAVHYLLNTDDEDRIYIGNGENGKVRKIFVASLNKPRSQWKIISLKEAVDKKNIYVTRAGKIYINNPLNSKVTELETGKETNYTGTLVRIYDLGIISRNDNKLIGTIF